MSDDKRDVAPAPEQSPSAIVEALGRKLDVLIESLRPAPPPKQEEPLSRRAIMDLSRPSLTPPPTVPWVNPEYATEVEWMREEVAMMFDEARDPFYCVKLSRQKSTISDQEARARLGITRKTGEGKQR